MYLMLIRHLESFKNDDTKFGDNNIHDQLTPLGQSKLESLSEYLISSFPVMVNSTIISSPKRRSIETAEGISKRCHSQMIVEDTLRPINAGLLSGISEKDAWLTFPNLMMQRKRHMEGKLDGYSISFPGGDTVRDYEKYVKVALLKLINKYRDNNFIPIVLHSSTIIHMLNIIDKYSHSKLIDRFNYFAIPLGSLVLVEIPVDISHSRYSFLHRNFHRREDGTKKVTSTAIAPFTALGKETPILRMNHFFNR